MKWTKNLDGKLIRLINLGKKHEDIAEILSTTKKSVSNRCNRLKLKIVSTKDYICLNCNNIFIGYIKEERVFCSKSCSNSYSNRNRKLSEETKNKISNKIKDKKSKEIFEQKFYNNPDLIKKIVRKCRFCSLFNVEKKHKLICDECKINYYQFYRPSCNFDFDINQFSNKFDMNLIKKYGWYSPTNKGNNLNGVSKDHMYSVREGFINKVNPEIIKHPANCSLILHVENNRKNFNSTITLDDLKRRIEEW
jgi:hypothetical protein